MKRIRHLAGDERGIALVFALVVLLALTIGLTAGLGSVTSNQTAAGVDALQLKADRLAFAGLNMASSVLQDPANSTLLANPALLPATTTALDGGSVTWQGSYNGGTGVWTLSATGTAPKSTGGQVTRSEQASVQITGPDGGGNYTAGALSSFR